MLVKYSLVIPTFHNNYDTIISLKIEINDIDNIN